MENLFYYIKIFPYLQTFGVYSGILILLLVYRKFRTNQWRKILKQSIEYHKFHLVSISKDPSVNQNSRDLAQSMLWGVTKQLPIDIKGGGWRALINSFSGKKTSLNTCGTVFYECARDPVSMDVIIFKLNNTLLSTIYRIFILESGLSILGLLYNDITLLFYLITKSESGTGRFYLNMKREISVKK